MANVSEEDELFASLEGLEKERVDPELAILLDLVAIAQKRLDEEPAKAQEIMDELNEQIPWINERVIITGEVFGPRLNDDNELQDSLVSYIDEPVVFKGFRVIHDLAYDDGTGKSNRPTLVYLFLTDGFTSRNEKFLLTQQRNDLFAVAYINTVQVQPERASPSYYANLAREYAPEYCAQLEAIAATSGSTHEVIRKLSTMPMRSPKDDLEGEGLYALSEYAYYLLKIDKNLPYDIEIEGSYFTNANIDMFSESDEFDEGVAKGTSSANVVGHTEGEPMHFLAGIEKLEPGPIPQFVGDDVIPTEELYWTLNLTIFGKDSSEDHITVLGVPAPHIKNIISIRQQHADSKAA